MASVVKGLLNITQEVLSHAKRVGTPWSSEREHDMYNTTDIGNEDPNYCEQHAILGQHFLPDFVSMMHYC